MLFLGAGASKPLGIPTMAEFTDVVLKDVMENKKLSFDSTVRGIQKDIRDFHFNPDIEAVLTVLEGQANPSKALADIGPSMTLFAEQYRLLAANPLASVAITEVEEAIYQRCVRVDHKLAVRLLGELWDALARNLTMRASEGAHERLRRNPLTKIFTTNYDLAVETFLKSRNYGFDDGFHHDDVGDTAFDGNWAEDRINVFKLHGSVNYFVKSDGKVVRSDAPLGEADLYGRPVRGRRMIYPTGEKYATRSPFYEYLGQLRQALASEQVCIVIGYSFRDMPINNAFLDGIQRNPHLRVLVVGPSADRLRSRLYVDLQRNVLSLNAEFGNSLLPKSIYDFFYNWPLPWPPW